MARTLKALCQARNGFKIRDIGDHKVFFIFENELDFNRILMSEPWSFDKNLVALQRNNEDVGKGSFASHTKQIAKAIQGFTPFMRDNIQL